uniref:Uncharacterized protein n=1 Tax=viral metagenome TaxID=1070528 RepID=A0A6C0JTL0_9ZZZZ
MYVREIKRFDPEMDGMDRVCKDTFKFRDYLVKNRDKKTTFLTTSLSSKFSTVTKKDGFITGMTMKKKNVDSFDLFHESNYHFEMEATTYKGTGRLQTHRERNSVTYHFIADKWLGLVSGKRIDFTFEATPDEEVEALDFEIAVGQLEPSSHETLDTEAWNVKFKAFRIDGLVTLIEFVGEEEETISLCTVDGSRMGSKGFKNVAERLAVTVPVPVPGTPTLKDFRKAAVRFGRRRGDSKDAYSIWNAGYGFLCGSTQDHYVSSEAVPDINRGSAGNFSTLITRCNVEVNNEGQKIVMEELCDKNYGTIERKIKGVYSDLTFYRDKYIDEVNMSADHKQYKTTKMMLATDVGIKYLTIMSTMSGKAYATISYNGSTDPKSLYSGYEFLNSNITDDGREALDWNYSDSVMSYGDDIDRLTEDLVSLETSDDSPYVSKISHFTDNYYVNKDSSDENGLLDAVVNSLRDFTELTVSEAAAIRADIKVNLCGMLDKPLRKQDGLTPWELGGNGYNVEKYLLHNGRGPTSFKHNICSSKDAMLDDKGTLYSLAVMIDHHIVVFKKKGVWKHRIYPCATPGAKSIILIQVNGLYYSLYALVDGEYHSMFRVDEKIEAVSARKFRAKFRNMGSQERKNMLEVFKESDPLRNLLRYKIMVSDE